MFGSKSKIFFTIALILMFAVLIFGLAFMTQYANVHVFYSKEDNVITIDSASNLAVGGLTMKNNYLFNFLKNSKNIPESVGLGYGSTDEEVAEVLRTVYNFQISASKYNDLIIGFVLTGLICVGILFLFDNHKRNVYYISNLVVGCATSLCMIIFSIVMIVMDLNLISNFESNKDLYKIVGVMQNPNVKATYKGSLVRKEYSELLSTGSDVNSATFYVTIGVFALIATYFTFILVFTLLKYKATSKVRKEVIDRAVNAND